MSPNLISSSLLSTFLILQIFIFTPSFSDNTPSTPVSTGTVCKSTPYPSFCRTLLPTDNSSANVYDYGRFSFKKSLHSSKKFLALINKSLRRQSSLTPTAVAALQDCRFLAELNHDFLYSSSQSVETNSTMLPVSEADDVLTMVSAILTNTQTCLDGLKASAGAWSVKNGVYAPMANDTKLYSVSLALFTKGWVPKKKKKKGKWSPGGDRFALGDGKLPLKMSKKNKAKFENVSRRKLLQTNEDNQINVNDVVIVSKDGTQDFVTIGDAVAAAPNNTDVSVGYFLIYVTEGVYEEYVSINKKKKYVMIIGDGINQTVITGNHSFIDGWTTFNSATFSVVGQGFVAINMTFRNTAGAIKHQAVAVRNGADLSTFYLCSFEGYQDTLYVHSLRQFYRDCDIYGTIDFIFGNAAVVFQNCNMYPRLPMYNQFNAITAQGRTDPNQNTGIIIENCTIRAADDLASSNGTTDTYLGRPWKLYSRAVYMQSFMDSLINFAGWREWNGDFALNTTYYAEFNNYGPGSNTTRRVNWSGYHIINSTDAANFTVSNFLMGDDWLPQSGVPYYSGLLVGG